MERKKIDEMTLSENIVYTLPNCDASTLKLAAKLMDGNLQTLLETGELNVKLLKVRFFSAFYLGDLQLNYDFYFVVQNIYTLPVYHGKTLITYMYISHASAFFY